MGNPGNTGFGNYLGPPQGAPQGSPDPRNTVNLDPAQKPNPNLPPTLLPSTQPGSQRAYNEIGDPNAPPKVGIGGTGDIGHGAFVSGGGKTKADVDYAAPQIDQSAAYYGGTIGGLQHQKDADQAAQYYDQQGLAQRSQYLGNLADQAANTQAARFDTSQALGDYNQGQIDRNMSLQTGMQQGGLGQTLQNEIAGKGGPSPAELQMQAGVQQSSQNALNIAAGASPGQEGLARLAALRGNSMGAQQAINQTAQLRAQERQQAIGQYGSLLGQQRQQDLGQQGADLAQRQASLGQAQFGAQNELAQRQLNNQQQQFLLGQQNQLLNTNLQNQQFYRGQTGQMDQSQLQANMALAQNNQQAQLQTLGYQNAWDQQLKQAEVQSAANNRSADLARDTQTHNETMDWLGAAEKGAGAIASMGMGLL